MTRSAAPESTLSHLECTACHATYSAEQLHSLCPKCNKVLYARYDLDRARTTLTAESLSHRPRGMWRWRELMLVRQEQYIISLGEGDTPLMHVPRLGMA